MKKIFFLALLFFFCRPALASELKGHISTDPGEDKPSVATSSPVKPGLAYPSVKGNAWLQLDKKIQSVNKENIEILGVRYFADHSLLRTPDKRIYRTERDLLQPIRTLLELRKWAGQMIIEVDWMEIADYQIRNHLDGELIRQEGAQQVFVIEKGQAKLVFSLDELRKNHSGKKINNLNGPELALYR
jgi:hypothetical protein